MVLFPLNPAAITPEQALAPAATSLADFATLFDNLRPLVNPGFPPEGKTPSLPAVDGAENIPRLEMAAARRALLTISPGRDGLHGARPLQTTQTGSPLSPQLPFCQTGDFDFCLPGNERLLVHPQLPFCQTNDFDSAPARQQMAQNETAGLAQVAAPAEPAHQQVSLTQPHQGVDFETVTPQAQPSTDLPPLITATTRQTATQIDPLAVTPTVPLPPNAAAATPASLALHEQRAPGFNSANPRAPTPPVSSVPAAEPDYAEDTAQLFSEVESLTLNTPPPRVAPQTHLALAPLIAQTEAAAPTAFFKRSPGAPGVDAAPAAATPVTIRSLLTELEPPAPSAPVTFKSLLTEIETPVAAAPVVFKPLRAENEPPVRVAPLLFKRLFTATAQPAAATPPAFKNLLTEQAVLPAPEAGAKPATPPAHTARQNPAAATLPPNRDGLLTQAAPARASANPSRPGEHPGPTNEAPPAASVSGGKELPVTREVAPPVFAVETPFAAARGIAVAPGVHNLGAARLSEQLAEPFISASAQVNPGAPHSLRLKLQPGELGQIEIVIERDAAGRLHAQLTVEHEQAQQALNSELGQLRETLEQAGLAVTRLEVVTGHQTQAHSGGPPPRFEQTPARRAAAAETPGAAPAHAAAQPPHRLLNLHA